MKRSYDQFCGLATALDIVGERWTLLIVRDLSLGPQRYTDILAGLPGIGSGLLSERLRQLEDDGIVCRGHLPPPANVAVYELTDDGRALAAALAPLSLWGARRLGADPEDRLFRAEWMLLSIRPFFRPEAARGVSDLYEFRIGGQTIHLRVDGGTLETYRGPAPVRPDLVVAADAATFVALGVGTLRAADALASGRVTFEGSPEALARCMAVFGMAPPAP